MELGICSSLSTTNLSAKLVMVMGTICPVIGGKVEVAVYSTVYERAGSGACLLPVDTITGEDR